MFEFDSEENTQTRKDVVGPAILALMTVPEEFLVTPEFVDEPTAPRAICMKHGQIVKGSDQFLVRLPVIGYCSACEVSK